ncbi:hypothetical protein KKHLCK_02490 [Candidatus Electrothrix laxa]
MNDQFTSSGNDDQNVGQGDGAIGKQENTTQQVIGDSNIVAGTGNVTVIMPAKGEEPLIPLGETNTVCRRLLDWLWPGLHYFLTVRLDLLPDPPGRDELEQRLREQQDEWIQELREQTFLPPPAKEVPKTPSQLSPGREKFYIPIQQLIKEIAGISSGGDAVSAQIAALSKKSKPVRSLVKKLRNTDKPLIVLGDPGAGKTITLKQVAIALSEENSRKVFPTLCLFIPLGRWKPVDRPTIRNVEALVAEAAGPELAPRLAGLAQQQRLTIIFDGLDEMSRQQYTKHTEALSEYAQRYTGQIQTLFSCRITDFSPVFLHSRLVLLPFTQRHITQYLFRQFGKEKQQVSGELLSIKELGKRLATEKLPIQPSNPFTLWLLSLYLRDKHCLPESKIQLLTFFFEYQYERKLKEVASAASVWPAKEELFEDWGQLALFITEQNQGTDIDLHEVQGKLGERADIVIDAGRACGVLHRSLVQDSRLIRFEHHRAQEYFAACGIIASKKKIPWKKRLDLPRWQETLVNVAQLNAQAAPLSILTERLQLIGSDNEEGEQVDAVSKVLRESQDAERVELSTRVLAAVPPSEEADALEQEVSRSVKWLVDKGNPTSQVKMLRLVDRLPDQDARDVVAKTMESKISWVRDQALEVAASISESVSASPLPIEVANAYGDGSILRLIGSRLRIAKKVKSKGLAVVSVISFVLFLLHIFVVGAITVGGASGSGVIRDVARNDYFYAKGFSIVEQVDSGELSEDEGNDKIEKLWEVRSQFREWVPRLVLVAVLLAIIGSVIWYPAYHWIIVPAAGFGTLSVLSGIYYLWCYIPSAILKEVAAGIFIIPISGAFLVALASFVWYLLAAGLVFLFSSILTLCILIWSKRISYAVSIYSTIFRNGGFRQYAEEVGGSWVFIVMMLMQGIAIQGIVWLYHWIIKPDHWWIKLGLSINRIVPDVPFLNRFFDYVLSALIIVGIISLIWSIIFLVKKERYKKLNKELINSFKVPLLSFGISTVILIAGEDDNKSSHREAEEAIEKLAGYSVSWAAEVVMFLLAVIIIIGAVAVLGWMIFRIWKKYSARKDIRLQRISRNQFEAAIESKDIDRQTQFLRCTDPGRLDLTTEDYFKLLVKMEPHITEEPALSQYYQKRIELEEILRQERHG